MPRPRSAYKSQSHRATSRASGAASRDPFTVFASRGRARRDAHVASVSGTGARGRRATSQLVVSDLGDQELVRAHSCGEPLPDILILSWMADLADYARIQEQLHRTRGSESLAPSRIGSTVSTLQSASSATGSCAHRTSIARTRDARSASSSRGDGGGVPGRSEPMLLSISRAGVWRQLEAMDAPQGAQIAQDPVGVADRYHMVARRIGTRRDITARDHRGRGRTASTY
jgi:hypothetical protein